MQIMIFSMLAFLFVVKPAWALELVKVATLPKGFSEFDAPLPVGDADHDGWQELYFAQTRPPFSLNIWEHWGQNSYQPVLIGEGTHPVALGDPDQDGMSDLLCAWNPPGGAFLLESLSSQEFPSEMVWYESIGGFLGIRGYFRDIDKDGNQEMWIVPNDPDQIEVWENRGDNKYSQIALITHPRMNPAVLAFGDFDQDGWEEIVTATVENLIFVWENRGDNIYDLVWNFEFSALDSLMVSGARDLDGDGISEFLITGRTTTFDHRIVIFECIGDNTYEPVWEVQGEGMAYRIHVVVGDIDGDGVEEFAVAIPGVIQLYEAFGDNDFRLIGEVPYPPFKTGYGGSAITLADLNENGIDELIVLAPDAKHTLIYELADIQPPVLIQAFYPKLYEIQAGKKLKVRFELLNRTEESKTISAWIEIYKGKGEGGPKGKPISTKYILKDELLSPQIPRLVEEFKIKMPQETGNYTVQLKVGGYPEEVIDTRWFTVKVK